LKTYSLKPVFYISNCHPLSLKINTLHIKFLISGQIKLGKRTAKIAIIYKTAKKEIRPEIVKSRGDLFS